MGLFTKSYESITAGLKKLVNDLNEHADSHLEKAAEHTELSKQHEAHATNAINEHDRARKTAQKIGALLDD